jgi:hypothetical protein
LLISLFLSKYPRAATPSHANLSIMDIKRQFPGVHWIWGGGISFVYEVHPRIVVKVPKSGEFEREKFQKELEIYRYIKYSRKILLVLLLCSVISFLALASSSSI